MFFVGTDDEDGVVAGDGAYDFGPIFIVDSCGDGLGAAGGGYEYEEVHGLPDFEAEAFEDFANSRERVFVRVGACRKGITGGAFIQTQFMNIAR